MNEAGTTNVVPYPWYVKTHCPGGKDRTPVVELYGNNVVLPFSTGTPKGDAAVIAPADVM